MKWSSSIDWLTSVTLLAQADAEGGDRAADAAQGAAPDSLTQILLSPLNFMLMIFVLFFLIVILPQQRQMKAQQRALADALAALKKNDRVITTGGIHGTIVQITPESSTVTIRIDEGTGAKLTLNREAIARVVNSDPKPST